MYSLVKDRWLTAALQTGLVILLVLILKDWGGQLPAFPNLKGRHVPLSQSVPVGKIEALFSAASLAQMMPATNAANPFFTSHFQPPPAPPPPPPATTRKVELIYQGFFQVESGAKNAFIKAGDSLVTGPVGTKVVADWVLASIELNTVLLTNNAAQTNLLQFNAKKEVEIPVK